MRYKLVISYDGTDFCGWQKQKDHDQGPSLPSVQESVENSLSKILQQNIKVCASGRTDAGVHAINQVIHFEASGKMPKDICWALRPYLPRSIVAKQAFQAPDEFHATLSAVRKTYIYQVWNAKRASALMDRYTYWWRKKLNIDDLNQASQNLVGEHDFASFQSVGTPVKHTVRRIFEAHWVQKNSSLVQFQVSGSGFLKQMVRNIVGTLMEGDFRGDSANRIQWIIAQKDRTKAGVTVEPQGLFLSRVYYPSELDKKCVEI